MYVIYGKTNTYRIFKRARLHVKSVVVVTVLVPVTVNLLATAPILTAK